MCFEILANVVEVRDGEPPLGVYDLFVDAARYGEGSDSEEVEDWREGDRRITKDVVVLEEDRFEGDLGTEVDRREVLGSRVDGLAKDRRRVERHGDAWVAKGGFNGT